MLDQLISSKKNSKSQKTPENSIFTQILNNIDSNKIQKTKPKTPNENLYDLFDKSEAQPKKLSNQEKKILSKIQSKNSFSSKTQNSRPSFSKKEPSNKPQSNNLKKKNIEIIEKPKIPTLKPVSIKPQETKKLSLEYLEKLKSMSDKLDIFNTDKITSIFKRDQIPKNSIPIKENIENDPSLKTQKNKIISIKKPDLIKEENKKKYDPLGGDKTKNQAKFKVAAAKKYSPFELKRNRHIEDDDEYDDDFIDDTPGTDYRQYVRKMFNYDPTKYKDHENDDLSMEAGFDDIEKEEKRSHYIAKLEDQKELKYIQKEMKAELHKKRKI